LRRYENWIDFGFSYKSISRKSNEGRPKMFCPVVAVEVGLFFSLGINRKKAIF